MANKVITVILVLLVILVAGIGYYSYTLNQQINSLSLQLTAYEAAQAVRVDTVSNELATLRIETQSNISALEGQAGLAPPQRISSGRGFQSPVHQVGSW